MRGTRASPAATANIAKVGPGGPTHPSKTARARVLSGSSCTAQSISPRLALSVMAANAMILFPEKNAARTTPIKKSTGRDIAASKAWAQPVTAPWLIFQSGEMVGQTGPGGKGFKRRAPCHRATLV